MKPLLRCFLPLLIAMTTCLTDAAHAEPDTTSIGLGHYRNTVRPGGEREPPSTINRAFSGPVPTNQWYASALFSETSEPLYAQPTSFRPTRHGLEIDTPVKSVMMDATREENDIAFPHRPGLLVAPRGFAVRETPVTRVSDWSIELALQDGDQALRATIVRGSPLSFYEVTQGDVVVSADRGARIFHHDASGQTLGVVALGRAYALYGPAGSRWETDGETRWVLRLPNNRRYFSIGALPEATTGAVRDFSRYAFAFVRDTQVNWAYDESRSLVTTTFRVRTEVKEGPESATLLGLLPHHWHANPLAPDFLPHRYETVRGTLRLAAGTEFRTQHRYHGILPFWPALSSNPARERLGQFLESELAYGADTLLSQRRNPGTYWEGKGLNRTVQVMAIAEQHGAREQAATLEQAVKERMQSWFRPQESRGGYFHYNDALGTLIGYPDEYGSAEQVNDHHFHYGYWIYAAAQIALRDRAWAAADRWGGMVEELIADIATEQAHHPRYPRLRVFDLYEGHSWASGTAPFFDGNNQESSSEAINAWASLILWGEATGNRRIRDLGIALYTTEVHSLRYYWFNRDGLVFAPEYLAADASMVWGSKYTHGTWFTDNPRMIHGINLLPITPASLYLGFDPDYVRRKLTSMDQEFERYLARGNRAPADTWQDILLSYAALDDAQDAVRRWNPAGAVEDGDSRTRTWHWLQSLVEMGRPDFTVVADAPLYAVFRRADGRRTYLAYNAGDKDRVVQYSDGTTLTVAPRSLGRLQRVGK